MAIQNKDDMSLFTNTLQEDILNEPVSIEWLETKGFNKTYEDASRPAETLNLGHPIAYHLPIFEKRFVAVMNNIVIADLQFTYYPMVWSGFLPNSPVVSYKIGDPAGRLRIQAYCRYGWPPTVQYILAKLGYWDNSKVLRRSNGFVDRWYDCKTNLDVLNTMVEHDAIVSEYMDVYDRLAETFAWVQPEKPITLQIPKSKPEMLKRI